MAEPLIKALPTRYAGCTFRSRTEARWAVYLDRLKIKWRYEPEAYLLRENLCYLPDFWLPQVHSFAEVKPEWPDAEEVEKMILLSRQTGHEVILLDGPPEAQNYFAFDSQTDISHDPWQDYFIDNQCMSESRFYSGTGGNMFPRVENNWDEAIEACNYAAKYRFDLRGGGNA